MRKQWKSCRIPPSSYRRWLFHGGWKGHGGLCWECTPQTRPLHPTRCVVCWSGSEGRMSGGKVVPLCTCLLSHGTHFRTTWICWETWLCTLPTASGTAQTGEVWSHYTGERQGKEHWVLGLVLCLVCSAQWALGRSLAFSRRRSPWEMCHLTRFLGFDRNIFTVTYLAPSLTFIRHLTDLRLPGRILLMGAGNKCKACYELRRLRKAACWPSASSRCPCWGSGELAQTGGVGQAALSHCTLDLTSVCPLL